MPNISRCKCIVIGDATVGKTSIVKMLLGPPQHQFPKKYIMTSGVDISSKTLRIPNSDDVVELFIYDCSGKKIYKDIVQSLWSSNVSLIVAVFDVTSEESFQILQSLLSDWAKSAKSQEKTLGVILGNKVDLSERRIISLEDAHQLAKRYKMRYFETSAKDAVGIEESFLYLITNWNEMQNNK